MEFKVNCISTKCNHPIRKVPSSPFVKCPMCKVDYYIFCHQFPNVQFTNTKCKKCPNSIYYFNCLKCAKVKAFTKFRMGSMTTCDCGLVGCYVKCNHCNKAQCFAPDRKYEGIVWKCKNCSKPINFMTCDRCFSENYLDQKQFQVNSVYECKNKDCAASLTIRKCQDCKFKFTDSQNNSKCQACKLIQTQNEKLKLKQENQKNKVQAPKTQSQTSCKVCYTNQAMYLNLECFHLTVCQQCVESMHNKCPICRSVGKFRKVFK